MYFQKNLKFLRNRKKRSQGDVAHTLDIPRSTLSGYENGVAQPGYESLINISEYFSIPIDVFLKKDLSEIKDRELYELENLKAPDLAGKNLRVLSITVDGDDRENIELVPEKAKAGYTTGYSNPDFVGLLSKFQLPFLGRSGTYRTFQISGDSMPPVKHGYWITAQFVDDWTQIKDGKPYILLTKEEGIVFKLIYNKIEDQNKLQLVSTNPTYEPYLVDVEDVKEVWQFVHSINTDFDVS